MMKPEELAAFIRKAGKAKRILEFEFPYVPDFYVKLAYASKFIMTQMNEVAREIYRDTRTGREEERFNNEKLRTEYAKHIVMGWRGLTVESLAKLLPGMVVKGDTDLKQEVPFSREITEAILEVSIEFENWVVNVACNIKNYSVIAQQKEKETENLEK